MADELEVLRLLKKRVEQIAQEYDTEVVQFVVIPADDPDEVDVVSVYFKLHLEAVETADQTVQRHTDTTFDSIFESIGFDDEILEEFSTEDEQEKKAKEQKKTEDIGEEILGWLDDINDD